MQTQTMDRSTMTTPVQQLTPPCGGKVSEPTFEQWVVDESHQKTSLLKDLVSEARRQNELLVTAVDTLVHVRQYLHKAEVNANKDRQESKAMADRFNTDFLKIMSNAFGSEEDESDEEEEQDDTCVNAPSAKGEIVVQLGDIQQQLEKEFAEPIAKRATELIGFKTMVAPDAAPQAKQNVLAVQSLIDPAQQVFSQTYTVNVSKFGTPMRVPGVKIRQVHVHIDFNKNPNAHTPRIEILNGSATVWIVDAKTDPINAFNVQVTLHGEKLS